MNADLKQLRHAEDLVRRAETTHNMVQRFQWFKCAAAIYNAEGQESLAAASEQMAKQTHELLEGNEYGP